MKTILLPLIVAGAATVAIVAPKFDNQRDKETRKTPAGTYWTEDTKPPISVFEPSSPVVVLTLAGAAILMTRNK